MTKRGNRETKSHTPFCKNYEQNLVCLTKQRQKAIRYLYILLGRNWSKKWKEVFIAFLKYCEDRKCWTRTDDNKVAMNNLSLGLDKCYNHSRRRDPRHKKAKKRPTIYRINMKLVFKAYGVDAGDSWRHFYEAKSPF